MDNYQEFKKFLSSLKDKPRLLLHSCCAPCSTHVLSLLKDYFTITVFYSNDNIYPKEEYQMRLDEILRFCKELDTPIEVIYDSYCSDDFFDCVKGLEDLGEKSQRCYQCYLLRMEKTVKKAKELGIEYFTTTLSISPHKKESWINEIGHALAKKYQVQYIYSNFKKENGYLHSIELSKQYHLYRQDYCGCVFSMKERSKEQNGTSKENQDKQNNDSH